MTTSPKTAGKKPDKKKIVHLLPCQLTPEEKAKKQKRLLELLDEVDSVLALGKLEAKLAKDKAAGMEVEALELRSVLKAGSEERDVQCEEVFDWTKGLVTTHRIDTGDKVVSLGQRKITAEERQTHLPEGK